MKQFPFLALFLAIPLSAQTVDFTLKAHVFDDGQKITALELDTHNLKFNRQKLTPNTFAIYAKGELPLETNDNKVFGLINGKQAVKKAVVNAKSNIELYFADNAQANRLAYVSGAVARNVVQKLDYDVRLQAVGFLPKNTEFKQGNIQDNEVDRFVAKTALSGLNYQLFIPDLQKIKENRPLAKRPLIVWLHGNGEGGVGDYQNNLSPLLANRGTVAFASPQAQRIFGGAYVVAPQVPDTWYNNYSNDYLSKIKGLVEEVANDNAVDHTRIYLVGASAGGYMALRLAIEYPELWAAVNVSAPAIDKAATAGGVPTTADELARLKNTPLWLVHAANDATISYANTSKRVFQTLRDNGAILTVYPEVKVGKKSYNGHWSWIYAARNEPVNPQGERLFQWLAKQRLN